MTHNRSRQFVYRLYRKAIDCIKDRRCPSRLDRLICYSLLKMETFLSRKRRNFCQAKCGKGKNLYASPVGKEGKKFLAKIIEKFGTDRFDYIIFVYDSTKFDEQIFEHCRFIYEKGIKWYFMKKYLTPEYCANYDYIFTWDDDIDIGSFSCEHFLQIMRKNGLEMAQPALVGGCQTHGITCQRKGGVGRLVDFVEIMVPVYTGEAWRRWWGMMETDHNYWGFGYDDLARALCGFVRMGIVDAEPVTHTRPLQSSSDSERLALRMREREEFFLKHRKLRRARMISYGNLH